MYCMDNEAIRFLVAAKNNNVKFSDQDKQDFAISWKRSADETRRLFEHVRKLNPHKTTETVSLNRARKMITDLVHPLAVITEEITMNKEKAKNIQNEIHRSKDQADQLDKIRLFERFQIYVKPLDFPRTVCSATKCVSVYTTTTNEKKLVVVI